MTPARDPRPLLDALPGWRGRAAKLKPLGAGFGNRTYRVDSRGETYVLRIAADPARVRAVERDAAIAVQRQAAAAGIAARVLEADAAAGVMLCEYLPGRAWTSDMLEDRGRLKQLAELLRRLHGLPLIGHTFAPKAAVGRYIDILRSRGAVPPFAERCRRVVEGRPAPAFLACCHNDMVAANVVEGAGLKLIDFDYACDNDPLFDLASLAGWHNLADDTVDYLVDAYGGGASGERRERLETERRLFDALQWLWLAARNGGRPSVRETCQMQLVRERLEDHLGR